jgi:hypothetical protein
MAHHPITFLDRNSLFSRKFFEVVFQLKQSKSANGDSPNVTSPVNLVR